MAHEVESMNLVDKFRKEAVDSHLFISDAEVEAFIGGTLASRRVSYRAQDLVYDDEYLGEHLMELLGMLKRLRDDYQSSGNVRYGQINSNPAGHGLLRRIKAAAQAFWS